MLECRPRFDYGRASHTTLIGEHGATFSSDDLRWRSLTHDRPRAARRRRGRRVPAQRGRERDLQPRDGATTSRSRRSSPTTRRPSRSSDTVRYWRGWLAQSHLPRPLARDGQPLGPHAQAAHLPARRARSSQRRPRACPSSSAASATGTTATPGSATRPSRSTRCCGSGFTEEAERLHGLAHATASASPPAGATGRSRSCTASTAGPTSRRRCSTTSRATAARRPVRIGNGAADQLQLDIYGELIDSVYLYNKYGEPISYDAWMDARAGCVDWVCENWDRADEGIWEMRGGRQHFTYSRLMSLGGDRARDPHRRQRGLPGRPRARGSRMRDQITTQIMTRGWNEKRQAFVQAYDVRRPRRVDAAHAAGAVHRARRTRGGSRPSTRSAASWSPTASSTATTPPPSPDGLDGDEGTFSICSFWYVEALARAGRLGRGPARLREDAHLRQPPRPLLRGDRAVRRAARQLPAGVHPPRADLGCGQPRSAAGVDLIAKPPSRGSPGPGIGRNMN